MRALTVTLEQNGDDESVHAEHTSHDDGDNRSEEQVGLQHGHGHDTDAGLGSAVGSAEVGEHEGGGDAHRSKEDGLVGVAKVYTKQSG